MTMDASRWSRRDLLLGAGAVATVAAAGPSVASAATSSRPDDFDDVDKEGDRRPRPMVRTTSMPPFRPPGSISL